MELFATTDSVDTQPIFSPRPPRTAAELDIPEALVEDLILRRLYLQGRGSISSLSRALKLSSPIILAVFQELRQRQLFHVTGMEGDDYAFTLTSAGKALAVERFQINQYAGAAPVSLAAYANAVTNQEPKLQLTRESLREALSDLVLPDGLLDQLGPAVMSGRSIFLYGPTGNGKTSLAERLLRVFDDAIVVPYAVEVDGQIVVVYDPVVHSRLEPSPAGLDPRWVVCRRPSVLVGGELDLGMLELQVDQATGIYVAPAQVKANNGILIIDDFGRQRLSPTYLLNRWIVPMDRGVDYLTLKYGVKFEIPFQMLLVFATNLKPADLADEAFFRRIPNKVFVGPVGPDAFDEIFSRIAAERGLPCETGSAEYLRGLCLERGEGQLRACYPRDMIGILRSIRTYRGEPDRVDREALREAVDLYFQKKED